MMILHVRKKIWQKIRFVKKLCWEKQNVISDISKIVEDLGDHLNVFNRFIKIEKNI